MTVSGSVLSPFQAARYERQTGTNCYGATYCLSVVFDERMNPPYLICELANSHGGDSAVLQNLVKAIKKIDYPRLGVKFQPFKPDTMSLPDYEWHTVYKQLYFSPHVWRHVIETAKSDVGDVWLDVFDQYGIDIAGEHLSDITGIKLQPSVLENQEVYRGLESFDLGHKILIVNVSGYCIDNIENIVAKFLCLEPSELVLQVGFQAYPTQAKDTALNKIAVLRKRFSTQKLCFADHYEGDQLFACRVPLMATVLGCEFIEKHVCLSRTDAVYDFHSALEIRGLETLATELILASNCFSSKFVSEREAHYLVSTQQIPITKNYLINRTLDTGFRSTYKLLDNQFIEMLGPYGGSNIIISNSSQLSRYHIGKIASYSLSLIIFIYFLITPPSFDFGELKVFKLFIHVNESVQVSKS